LPQSGHMPTRTKAGYAQCEEVAGAPTERARMAGAPIQPSKLITPSYALLCGQVCGNIS